MTEGEVAAYREGLKAAAQHVADNAYDLAVYDECACRGSCNADCVDILKTAEALAASILVLPDAK